MGPYDGFHPMTVFTPCYTALEAAEATQVRESESQSKGQSEDEVEEAGEREALVDLFSDELEKELEGVEEEMFAGAAAEEKEDREDPQQQGTPVRDGTQKLTQQDFSEGGRTQKLTLYEKIMRGAKMQAKASKENNGAKANGSGRGKTGGASKPSAATRKRATGKRKGGVAVE